VMHENRFEDTKGVSVIRSRKSKDRQYNGKKKTKGQTIIYKTTQKIID
jgi:hypothetical protein